MMDNTGISLSSAIGILFFLLLASAFFSGSETALTRARRVRLRLLSEKGDKGAAHAEHLIEHPETMLAAVLLGNNFVNIAASSLATTLFVAWFGQAGILYATAAMTVVVLILAEILPKTIAVAHAETIACKVATPLKWMMWLFAPAISLLMYVIRAAQAVMRSKHDMEAELTHSELAGMIGMSAETGVLDEAREQMLMSSLHLHQILVKSLMTPRKDILLLNADKTVADCLKMVMNEPYSRYPVFHGKNDHIIGIIHLRDLLKQREQQIPLLNAMIWHDPPFIPDNKNALAQLFDFQTYHQHMAIVVDEYGNIDGLITLEDIIEDIVGEIVDESDPPEPVEMWAQPDGSWVIAGTAGLHDINQELNIDLPEEGATTIGGLIVELLGEPPEAWLCLDVEGIHIEILNLKKKKIRRVKIDKPHKK